MSFGLDHPVIAVRDLERTAERARALGFTLNTRHQHPWGTDNHLLLFERNFIELMAIIRPGQLDYADDNNFRFGRLIESRLRHVDRLGDGIVMVGLESEDMVHDHAVLLGRGLTHVRPTIFRRLAHLADGRDEEVGVALDIIYHRDAPWLTQFLCQQLSPELLRQDPSLTVHANTAIALTDIWYVSSTRQRDLGHFRDIHGEAAITPEAGGFTIATDKGDCHLLDTTTMGERFPLLAGLPPTPSRAVALTLACRDLSAAMALWQANGVDFVRHDEHHADIPPHELGPLLRFVQC
ncbi:VOC family protein [Kushneria phosphatilytica]|uniref:VOC family protein n=1 Tax=Kushneria phosphatilytica TaxID=657387 RepID=A0A1S1NN22_9GAMM|nr:VOC family protein [Kushneria phosphatilytica]OHV08707.1 hypothetical protein BH688_11810 [Kushneria phosphatilytica]QEL12427.1 VOC family protein [Kushneria phosphatilytica]